MKPVYFLSKTVLSLPPYDHDWLVATMRGDLDETHFELVKAIDEDLRKHCYFNKTRITNLGGAIAITSIGEVINSNTEITFLQLQRLEFYYGDSPNILPVTFFHVLAPRQKEVIEDFVHCRLSGDYGTEPFEFISIPLVNGWMAIPNLIGSYTFNKEA